MFEGVDEAGLVSTIAEATCAEASAAAVRSAAIAELMTRRGVGDDDDPRALWACDPWASVAAEIGAAMSISHGKACGQMRIAETLRDHLPQVAARFGQGRLSARVVSMITWRTRLITDEQVWALIDTALAERAGAWGPLTDEELRAAVDALVLGADKEAVIASQARSRGRDFTVGSHEDETGAVSVWGKLSGPDAEVLNRRVAAIAATVCPDDPRSAGELRSDAVGTISNGNNHLPCACGSRTCPANAAQHRAPNSSVVINVYADSAAVDAAHQQTSQTSNADQTSDAPSHPSAGQSDDQASDESDVHSSDQSSPRRAACKPGTAVMFGVGGPEILSTPMLAALLRNGATLRPLGEPEQAPEPRYRPSATLARRVRARDLRCRFPGCSRRAELCDLDHVVAHPGGVTHESNLACLCRFHHLLKTFWIGDWSYLLRADGAAIWTAPTGHTYTTYPGSRTLFPNWDTTAADLPPPQTTPAPTTDRGLKMPIRKQPRSAQHTQRINTERTHNTSDQPPF